MKIHLSDHFTYKKLLRFAAPTVITMIISSVYSIVDGFFVSNYVSKNAFASVNLIMPIVMAISCVGFMLSAGGSALVAKTLGEGKRKHANELFSMLVYVTIAAGILFSIVGFVFMPQLAQFAGADAALIADCVRYGRILLVGNTAFMLQITFQSFFIVAEKPKLSLLMSVCGGVTNIVLDFLFIYVFEWGITGAAVATFLGQVVAGVTPLIYFACPNSSLLRLTRARLDVPALLRSCLNGSSEMVTNLSSSVVSILYNYQLIKYAGADGVAAYGVIMYVNFIFVGIYVGFSFGTAPIVSYHYGAANHAELKNLFKKSMLLVSIAAVVMTALAEIFAAPLSTLFVGYDTALCDMTRIAFRLYSTSFLICGFNIFGSGFFTALNDGLRSAVISFLRTLGFQIAAVLTLPLVLGINGIWLALTVAEGLTLAVTLALLARNRSKYHYA